MHTIPQIHRPWAARPQRNLLSAGLVASLHLAAIYTLLVALDVVPNPIKPTPPPIHVRVIDQTPAIPQPPEPPTPGKVVLRTPRSVPEPLPPPLQWATQGGRAITLPPPQPPTDTRVPAPPGPTLPVRALADTHTIPPYPPLGIRLAHEGTAKLRITVDEQGNVVTADLIQSTGHEELDAAAVAWVKSHWRYQPAMQDGHAIGGVTNAILTFRLDQAHG
jgi:periplasmic protein TonB